MVSARYIYSYYGYKPTYNWGAQPCNFFMLYSPVVSRRFIKRLWSTKPWDDHISTAAPVERTVSDFKDSKNQGTISKSWIFMVFPDFANLCTETPKANLYIYIYVYMYIYIYVGTVTVVWRRAFLVSGEMNI